MYTLQQIEQVEQILKKSRFLATAGPVQDEDAAREFIRAHSHSGANHNCWAWRVGARYRFSDDGEPGGTAGRPILQAIESQSIDNVAVVVARWFGGVLLGTGGLARAYGGTAASCLRAASLIEIIPSCGLALRIGFSDLSLIMARLASTDGVRILSETFIDSGAEITACVPESLFDELCERLTDATGGRIEFLADNRPQ